MLYGGQPVHTTRDYRKATKWMKLGDKVRIPSELSSDGKPHTGTVKQICTHTICFELENKMRVSYSHFDCSKFTSAS